MARESPLRVGLQYIKVDRFQRQTVVAVWSAATFKARPERAFIESEKDAVPVELAGFCKIEEPTCRPHRVLSRIVKKWCAIMGKSGDESHNWTCKDHCPAAPRPPSFPQLSIEFGEATS